LATATFSLEDGMLTTDFSAIWALRIRVSMSANGSCILMGSWLLIRKNKPLRARVASRQVRKNARLWRAGHSRERAETNQAPEGLDSSTSSPTVKPDLLLTSWP